MINDSVALQECQKEWDAVRFTQEKLRANVVASWGMGGWALAPQVGNEIYSLLLPFGFSVLEHVLLQMKAEGLFSCGGSSLKQLMRDSRPALTWADFDAVDRGRNVRNDLIHDQKIPQHDDTFRILDEIERELIGWGVLSGPVRHNLTTSISAWTSG
jgi:hypothetical protein